MSRRQVNGYEWRNELEKLSHIGEQMASELLELSREAATVHSARTFTRLVDNSRQISIKALRLKEYRDTEAAT